MNLAEAAGRLGRIVNGRAQVQGVGGNEVAEAYIEAAERMLDDDVRDNRAIGESGAKWVLEHAITKGSISGTGQAKVAVLTHCNTGYVNIMLIWRDVLVLAVVKCVAMHC